MLDDFAQLLAEVFPSVEPETARRFIQAARVRQPLPIELYSPSLLEGLCQADVIAEVPFRVLGSEGKWTEATGYGLVLSQSCDVEHDDDLILAYGFPFRDLERNDREPAPQGLAENVARNIVLNMLFLPAVPNAGDLVFDLSIVSTYSSRFVTRAIDDGRLRRCASLSQLGYYMFIAKLTLHLLRPEREVSRPRSVKLPIRDRLVGALRLLRGS